MGSNDLPKSDLVIKKNVILLAGIQDEILRSWFEMVKTGYEQQEEETNPETQFLEKAILIVIDLIYDFYPLINEELVAEIIEYLTEEVQNQLGEDRDRTLIFTEYQRIQFTAEIKARKIKQDLHLSGHADSAAALHHGYPFEG